MTERPTDVCEACGVLWTKHKGLVPTCQNVQDALARERNYQEQIGSLLKQRNEAQARVRRLAEIADYFWAGRGRAMRTAWHFYEKYAQLREQIRRERVSNEGNGINQQV